MTPNPTTPAPTEEERADYLLKCNTDLNAHVRDLSEQLRKERSAIAEAKARCAELEKTNKELKEVCDLVGSQLEASAQDCIDETQHREQIEKNCLQAFDLSQQWQKDCELAKARAETAEAQCDRMKAALEECQRILEDEAPELNITNYDDSQAYDLNEAANKVYGVIRAALSTPPAEEKPS